MKAFRYCFFAWWLIFQDWTAAYVHEVKRGPFVTQQECQMLGKEASDLRNNLVLHFWCKTDYQLEHEQYLLELTEPLERLYQERMQHLLQ